MKNKLALFSTALLVTSQLILPVTSFATDSSNHSESSAESQNNQDEQATVGSETAKQEVLQNDTVNQESKNTSERKTETTTEEYDSLEDSSTPETNSISTSLTSLDLKTTYPDGKTFSGKSTFSLKIDMGDSSYSIGDKVNIKIDNTDIISQLAPNGGASYGSWDVDLSTGSIVYTITSTFPKDTSLVVNITTKNADSGNPVTIKTSLNNQPTASTNTFSTKYVNPGGGGDYGGTMLFPAYGKYDVQGVNITSPSGMVENNLSGTAAYLPVVASMNASFVYDAGFYNKSKNDWVNRKITLTVTAADSTVQPSLDPANIYITNHGVYNTTKPDSYIPIASLGITATSIDKNTVELSLPDNTDFSWYIFYFTAGTPSLDTTYNFTTTYTSDL